MTGAARPPGALEKWDGVRVETLAARWGVPAVEAYASIGSTNDRAAELAARGAAPFTTVVADVQTAGRGRRAARWWSEPGEGLLMSIVAPRIPDAGLACLPLLVGLAVVEAVEAACPSVRVAVKWPNDLLVGDRKLAGILCEARGGAVVVGVGVNVSGPAAGREGPVDDVATSLHRESCKGCMRNDIARLSSRRIKSRLGRASATLAPDAVRALATSDALLGREVETEEHGRGVARGIERDGSLVLERADGTTARVRAGSVSLIASSGG